MEKKKKQFKMPHTFVIIGIIILLAVLLTWIIPAGSYTRFENEAGIKVIDPNDFNYIDQTPVNPLEIPLYIVKAFIKRIDLMLVIMFAGGAFHILTKTGALHAVVAKMAKVFSTRVYLFLPILTLVFGLICTTQGVNLFIAFAPIMVMMAFAMGLDSITGASIILLGGAIGFSTGPLNINTTIVAQKIAGLPLYSGVGYRFICFVLCYHQHLPHPLRTEDPETSRTQPHVRARQDQRVPRCCGPRLLRQAGRPQDPHHAGLLRIPYPHRLRRHQARLGYV